MGVELEDAGKVASLLGTKVFVDEFISFMDLGNMINKEASRLYAELLLCVCWHTEQI